MMMIFFKYFYVGVLHGAPGYGKWTLWSIINKQPIFFSIETNVIYDDK